MYIVILGAGQVGANLAKKLSEDLQNEIALVDADSSVLHELREQLDIRTVHGKASYPHVLKEAGAKEADMLIAVTHSDEINMLAAEMAYHMFKVKTILARVREGPYSSYRNLLEGRGKYTNNGFHINVIITPEVQVCEHVYNMIFYPNASNILEFAKGKIKLASIQIEENNRFVGSTIKKIYEYAKNLEIRITAIFRDNQMFIPENDTVLEADDKMFFISSSGIVRKVLALFRRSQLGANKIVIAGGGNIGKLLAKKLEIYSQVKVIERNTEICDELALDLTSTLVIQGDATDRQLLLEENLDKCDVFCALTNNDESNVLSSLIAKSLGVPKILTIVSKGAYSRLAENELVSLDSIIAPQEITLSSILSYTRPGDVVQVHSIHNGIGESLEVIVKQGKHRSQIINHAISQIPLPAGCQICAVLRDDVVHIVYDDFVIEEFDHVIFFISQVESIHELEKLFHVH